MSITNNFEALPAGCMECGGPYIKDVVALLDHARALEAMLKGFEWVDNEWDEKWCLNCGNPIESGHSPDCQLARLLEGVE